MKVLLMTCSSSGRTIEPLIKRYGFDYEILEGVKGTELLSFLGPTGLNYELLPGEIGNLIGCMNAWKRIIEINEPVILLEDDAIPIKNYNMLIYSITKFLEINPDAKLVQLSNRDCNIHSKEEFQLSKPISIGSDAMIITPAGAKACFELKRFKQSDLIYMELSMEGDCFIATSPFFKHNWDIPSTIQPK